ncbi:hypothetical protein ACN6LA_006813, partial [Streptomyces sp. SAS_269]
DPAGADLPREHNGLIEVQDGIATVQTGIHTGEVDVITVLRQPDSGLPGRRASEAGPRALGRFAAVKYASAGHEG